MVTDRPANHRPAAPSGDTRGFHARILATNEGLRAMVARERATAADAPAPDRRRAPRRGLKREDR